MWEVPPQTKAVLLALHGCSHSGTDFWEQSEACPRCLGLPEEVIIRRAALEHGYALIAPSSSNRERKCWHMQFEDPSSSNDAKVVSVVGDVMKEEGLLGLPIFVVGVSSGGGFALMVPHLLPVKVRMHAWAQRQPRARLALPPTFAPCLRAALLVRAGRVRPDHACAHQPAHAEERQALPAHSVCGHGREGPGEARVG